MIEMYFAKRSNNFPNIKKNYIILQISNISCMPHLIFIGYLLCISLLTFILFGVDKRRAVRKAWRIPESRLLLASLLGGSAGGLLGMYIFNHKTRHNKFTMGLPIILMLQIMAGIYLFNTLK